MIKVNPISFKVSQSQSQSHYTPTLTVADTSQIVSWNWGGGQPGGKVVETKTEGEIAIKSKRGNTIKKNASPSNPAVHIGRSGNDVVKRASELHVDEKASGSTPAKENGDKKREHDEVDDDDDDAGEVGAEDADKAVEDKEEEEEKKEEVVKKPAAKKQKKEPAAAKKKKAAAEDKKPAPAGKEEEKKQANGDEAKKGRGRPKGTASGAVSGGAKKKRDPKPRATEGIGSRTRSRA